MEPTTISRKLLRRLPIYLNYMKSLPEDMENISATRMAAALDLGDVMVRKDLAKVSSGGRRKLGYVRANLIQDIEEFLDMNRITCAVIVGAGKLGQALLDYEGFEKSGLNLMAGFDIHPAGKQFSCSKPVYPMNRLESFCHHYDVRIGVIAVPAESAQTVCNQLVACGIRAIWNFAPTHLQVPEGVVVQTENLAVSLTALRMQLKNQVESNL